MNWKMSIIGLVLAMIMLIPFISARTDTTSDIISDTVDEEIIPPNDGICCKKNLCWICDIEDNETTTTLPPTTTTTLKHHSHHNTPTTTTSTTTTTTIKKIPIELERLTWIKHGTLSEYYLYLDWLRVSSQHPEYSYMYNGVAKKTNSVTTGYYIIEEQTFYPVDGLPQSMEFKNIPEGTIVV